jgi:hypothetical protein
MIFPCKKNYKSWYYRIPGFQVRNHSYILISTAQIFFLDISCQQLMTIIFVANKVALHVDKSTSSVRFFATLEFLKKEFIINLSINQPQEKSDVMRRENRLGKLNSGFSVSRKCL